MRSLRLLLAALLVLLLAAATGSAQRKYGIRSGIITFENSVAILGKPAAQRQILYFDDYGLRERKELYEGDTLQEAVICDGMHIFTLVFAESVAYRGGNSTQGSEAPFRRDTTHGRTWKTLTPMTIAGRVCEAIASEGPEGRTTLAGWNGIVVFAENNAAGIHTSTKAVKISELPKIPPEKFRVPASFTVK